jgi:hypothetical protein
METEYDPEHEAVAAMKLAAEADGAERQRWINAALAWIELTRLRVSGREPSGRKRRSSHSPTIPPPMLAPQLISSTI